MAGSSQKPPSAGAVAYARALLDLAGVAKNAAAINADLQSLRTAINDEHRLALFLHDPGIRSNSKLAVLRKALAAAPPLLLSFIGVMARHNRLSLLAEAALAFDQLLAEQAGRIDVHVTVAKPLSPDQLERIRREIGQALERDAVIHPAVDESLIGGLVVRVQDRLIDASVRCQLELLRQRLLTARPAASG
jgi:F-type H+-transporting ATPase subunit delta